MINQRPTILSNSSPLEVGNYGHEGAFQVFSDHVVEDTNSFVQDTNSFVQDTNSFVQNWNSFVQNSNNNTPIIGSTQNLSTFSIKNSNTRRVYQRVFDSNLQSVGFVEQITKPVDPWEDSGSFENAHQNFDPSQNSNLNSVVIETNYAGSKLNIALDRLMRDEQDFGNPVTEVSSVTRLSNLLDFGQLFKAFGNN